MASPMSSSAESDLLRALEFVEARFADWRAKGWVRADQFGAVQAYYARLRKAAEGDEALTDDFQLRPRQQCWSCKAPLRRDDFCAECGAPVGAEAVDRLRYLVFLCFEIKKHERAGRLDLSAAHECLAESNERIAALRRRLNQDRALPVLPVAEAPKPAEAPEEILPVVDDRRPRPPRRRPERERAPAAPRRSLLEILLDPHSIQWLLASGAAVLVLGLVIWLATNPWFQQPLFVAILLGAANAALLGGGWALIRLTRYELAGRALTLLACLLMPLNLWFYDYHNLISIRNGDHLWAAALVCCVLYAVSAALLRDPMFVYVFTAGVVLTGLLLLADLLQAGFWSAAAPALLLVAVGLVCLHAERFFPDRDGPFSRKGFGLAFFWSGQVVLGAGLLVVLWTQLIDALLYKTFAEDFYRDLGVARPDLTSTDLGRWLAFGLVAAAVYAYVYSDLVVRRVGVYLYLAVFAFLWAELLLLDLLTGGKPSVELFIVAPALTGLAANLLLTYVVPKGSTLWRSSLPLGVLLCALPLLLGVLLHFRATALSPYHPWYYALSWPYVVAMALTALSCRVGAYLYRETLPALSTVYFFGTVAATLVGAAGLLVAASEARGHRMEWEWQAPLLMAIPLLYLIAARLNRGGTSERPLVWVAHTATIILLISCLGLAVRGFVLQQGQILNLMLAIFFIEAAVFYYLAAAWRNRVVSGYAGTLMAAAALWQLLKYFSLPDEDYAGAFAVLGLALLLGYRFAVLEKAPVAGLTRVAFQSANALLSLALIAGALLALDRLLEPPPDLSLLIGLEAVLLAAGTAAVFLVRPWGWRAWYLVAVLVNAALTVAILLLRLELTAWQKFELVSVILGVGLLVAGHVGWFREQERQSELVTLALLLGALFTAAPLTCSVIYCRFGYPTFDLFHKLNEIGMLAAGLLLLGSGAMMRLKATTLVGAITMVVYLFSLLAFIQLPAFLQTAAVYMMIGGGLFFAVGLVLSFYRDRLLTLPARIKRREGVFRVLDWR